MRKMSDKLDINGLLALENELKLMAIISNAIVNNRISLKEHYAFIVRDIIFPQTNPDIMEVPNSSQIWGLARYIVNNKDVRQFNTSNIIIMRGTGSSYKPIDRKRFVQEIIKSFDIKSNKEIENCLSRIVKMLETLIQQNMYIELHDMFTKGSKMDTIINNSNLNCYKYNVNAI